MKVLKIEKLSDRRERLALKFAKGCTKMKQMKDLFELSSKKYHDTRGENQVKVKFASTSRLYKSAVPALQRLLNSNSHK